MSESAAAHDLESLLSDLRSPDADVRRRAVRALLELNDMRALEALIVALQDDDSEVRTLAARALGALSDQRAVAPLQFALEDSDEYVRNAAEDSLVQIAEAGSSQINDMIALDTPWQPQAEGKMSQDESAAPPAGQPAPVARPEQLSAPAEPVAPPQPEPAEQPTPAQRPPQYMSADRARRSSSALSRTPPQSQPPHFSVFHPEGVKPGQTSAMMAFVHLESAYQQIREIASGFTGIMGGTPTISTAQSNFSVDVGSLITFVPHVAGIQFSSIALTVTWLPPYQSVTFLFTVPLNLKSDLTGHITVYQGPLVLGEIPIHMRLLVEPATESNNLTAESQITRFDPVFASYSHRDFPVMEYFRRVRQSLGQTMLVDIYDLRAGDHWADRLLEMIDQSAAFQLFWSKHSAESNYCRQEWEHALAYADSRPRFIQPVWWDEPMPSPPLALAGIHFQRVQLPPLTRAELVAAHIRRMFRRG